MVDVMQWLNLPNQTTPLSATRLNQWSADVKLVADAADASAAAAAASAAAATAPTDTQVADLINNPASLTAIALPNVSAPLLVAGKGVVRQDSLVKMFTGSGDSTVALQAFLDGLSAGDSALIRGTFTFTTVTCSISSVNIRLAPDAMLTKTTAFTDGIVLTGDDVTLSGGTITSPASWDGANVTPTYAVIRATGDRHAIIGMTLINVPKVGIASRDGDGTCIIARNRVVGNYPAASWDEIGTVHFGIQYDPGVTSANVVISDNTVSSCVQGAFLGNYGLGAGLHAVVRNNHFEGCHNHAIYNAGNAGSCVVDGNTVLDCSRPIVMSGEGHVVVNNLMTTTGTGGNLNATCGIQMRDAVGCTVAFNYMKGDTTATDAPIDLFPVSGGVVIRDNLVIGNHIEVTGTNATNGIRVGTTAITDHRNNIVQSNTIRSPGSTVGGVIAFFASGSVGFGNKVLDNDITVVGASRGIYVGGQTGIDVRGNYIRFEYDSASTVTLAGVYLESTATAARVRDNDIVCTASYGLNITLRAVWEVSGTTANRIGPNRYALDPTRLNAAVIHIIQGTSGSVLDEVLPGAPATVCGPGSVWRRTDGGVGTSLYVKETAANSATWARVNTTTP